MLENIALLRVAEQISAHASSRHGTISKNIAHADTPGFKAIDLEPLSPRVENSASSMGMLRTRENHFAASIASPSYTPRIDTEAPVSANGNSVSLEREMVRMAENRMNYDLALSVYKSTINILRTSIGK